MKTLIFLFLSLAFLPVFSQNEQLPDRKIWYTHPATSWNEALPVGNGRLGAMVYGRIASERIQLNEETVWSGRPEIFVNPDAKTALPEIRRLLFQGKYAEAKELAQKKMMGDKKVWSSYQTLGDLDLEFSESDSEISDYHRELDLDNATVRISYRQDNVSFKRELISSAPDQAIVIRISADKPGSLTFSSSLTRPGGQAKTEIASNEIILSEHVNGGEGVKLVARLKIVNTGGNLIKSEGKILIEGADTVTLYLTAGTDYWGGNPVEETKVQIEEVIKKPYKRVLEDHVSDYQKYFKRVDLNLGESEAIHYPTDSRIKAVQEGVEDPALLMLYYQFGRYLLISSSRPGGLPANLQGIWADGLNPPWSADYHININIQMNYWPAEITNLPEMHLPFIQFLDRLRPNARKTAKSMYGISGTVAHFTTDVWHFTEPYGETQWAMWPMGMAWCAQHAWEHYLFNEEKEYLKDLGYPIMKEAAEFCANWLVENPKTKKLVSGPSISPENTFKTEDGEVATMVMGPTMDHMIIRDLFENTIAAGKILNKDATFRQRLEKILEKLAPVQIGKDGRIMEWTEEFEEAEPGHRHISHLFALHPGRQITKQHNPELLEAARKTIDYRLSHGGGHTGWSRAWIINFFARLKDGEKAYENLTALISKSTLPNLFDTHPPFQIDGNFGATAGITEMLLQSHAGEIEFLPALPKAWPQGHIRGLRARGGFEIDVEWENRTLKRAKVTSNNGNRCFVRYGEKSFSFDTQKGATYQLTENLQLISN